MRALTLSAAALTGVAAITFAAFAAQGAPPSNKTANNRACFFHDMANGFSAPDDHTVYVRAGVRDVYKLDLFGPCPNVDWTMRIGLQNRGSSWVCVGDVVDILVRDPGLGRERCMAKVTAKLTPEEVAALPRKAKP